MANERTNFTCFVCKIVVKGSYTKLTAHLKTIHSFKTASSERRDLICGQNSCTAQMKTFANYRYHLMSCELYSLSPNSTNRVLQLSNNVGNFQISADSLSSSIPMSGECHGQSSIVHETKFEDKIERAVAKLMLALRTKHNVTNESLNFVSSEIVAILQERDIHEDLPLPILIKAFKQLNSQKNRTNFYTKNFGLQSPRQLLSVITRRWANRFNSNSLSQRIVPRIFHYISIKGTLSTLFSIPKFREAYFNEKASSDGKMRSHLDAAHYKSHELFKLAPRALRMQVFNDDLEVCNPCGSKTKKHQLAMFCFCILNLPPILMSQLCHIHPFAVCHTLDVAEDNFSFVLREFMSELHELESARGMPLDLSDFDNFFLRGTVVSVCADTKGAHEIGGFMSPSANKCCRLCLIDRCDINYNSNLDQLELRSKDNYDAAVVASNRDVSEIRKTGVKYASLFNASRYFHFAENLILDAMHDFLEGVAPFSIKLVLRALNVNHPELGITASFINERINLFQYSYYDLENKPSAKFTDDIIKQIGNYSTKQRASQNFCLINVLPFLIGDKIPEGNKYFTLILTLRHIMDIIFSPVLTMEHTVELEMLISQYFDQFNSAFPETQGINKLHHMVHYPQIIREHGPPMRYWCMRYEAYHNIAKRLAQVNFNFKNLTLSVSKHLQLVKCSSLQNDSVFETRRKETGPLETHLCHEIIDFDSIQTHHFDPYSKVNVAPWVKIQGWEYRVHTVVLLKMAAETVNGLPVFAQVKKILVKENNDFFLIISHLNTDCFSEHYHAFEVSFTNLFAVVSVDELAECEPLWIVKNFDLLSDKSFVSPRHVV